MRAGGLAIELPADEPARLAAVREPEQPFEEFYEAHHARLLRFVRRRFLGVDAEEVAQEAMIRAMTHYWQVDHARDPWPWLSVIASNVARDLCRARQRHPLVDLDSQQEMADVLAETPDEHAEAAETAALLRSALIALPPHYRVLLLLREADGMGIADIAEMFDTTPNTIRQQLLRARRRLLREFVTLEEARRPASAPGGCPKRTAPVAC